jgi:phytoene desaturase
MPFEAPHAETQPKALVIGGGFGGMAAALRLRARGYRVELVDQRPMLGGRAQVFEREGFRHDAGPTVLCAPSLFRDLFALFDETFDDHVTLVEPKPWYRFTYADGSNFDYGPTREHTNAEIARLSPEDAESYDKLTEYGKSLYDIAFEKLSDQPFHNPLFMARQVPDLVRLRTYRTVWQTAKSFFRDDRLRRAFSIQPLLLGGNPLDTTGLYSLISYLERKEGVWFPLGGTGALVQALSDLMTRQGIDVRLNTSVEQLALDGTRVTGAIIAGREEKADIVVSNCDPLHLYQNMIHDSARARFPRLRLKHGKVSMGLFVLYFGATRQWPDVAHHTVQFSERFEGLLRDIFDHGKLTHDMSLYIHRPTATDPSFAPDGCDSFYVLCPVPNLQDTDIDWDVEGPRMRDRVVAHLDATTLPGLKKSITAEFWMTPEDFRSDYASLHGAGFSLAPLFRQSAYFRFHNRGEGLENLYLVGGGTHPGAGVPGAVLSAKVLDALVPEPVS